MADDQLYSQLLSHLEHPFFCVPLISYIESQCICFSPDLSDCEEYRKMHKEYAQLVTQLLDSFREDLKLSHAEVVKSLNAIQSKNKGAGNESNTTTIERVLAMEDYELFVRLMQRSNVELQQQALALITVLNASKEGVKADDDDDPVLALVLQISKEEFEEDCLKKSHNEAELKKALELSREETKKLSEIQKKDMARLDKQRTSSEVKQLALAPSELSQKPLPSLDKEPLKQPKVQAPAAVPAAVPVAAPAAAKLPAVSPPQSKSSSAEASGDWTSRAMAEASAASSKATVTRMAQAFGNLTPEELEKKQAFLRAHRDKLVQMKQKEREQQLAAEEKSFGRQRPVSARAARSAMTSKPKPQDAEAEKKLAMRRAIAAKLKEEVIDK